MKTPSRLPRPAWTRRQFLSRAGASFLGLAGGAGVLRGEDRERLPDGSAARNMITPAAQRAIDQGLAFLAGAQHPDGSFGDRQYHGNVGITSLAALAMMAGGSQPGRGRYGNVVSRALEFVLSQEDRNTPGFLHNSTVTTHVRSRYRSPNSVRTASRSASDQALVWSLGIDGG